MLSPEQVAALVIQTWFQILLLLCAAGMIALALLLGRRHRSGRYRWLRRAWAAALLLLALPTALVGGYLFWFTHRAQPLPTQRDLFTGIHYRRIVRQAPRPLVINVVTVALQRPDITFLCTPPTGPHSAPLAAHTVSRFLTQNHAQVAINGSYYHPCTGSYPWNYYPHNGDFVDIIGINASRGNVYHPQRWTDGTLFLSADSDASMGTNDHAPTIYNAISGGEIIVLHGQPRTLREPGLNARSAVGLSADRRTLILVTVDGHQPHVSEGVTMNELAALLPALGCDVAMNLDGGGSTTLVYQNPAGHAQLLNSPCNFGLIGCERPVANQLAVFAPPFHAATYP